MSLVCMRQKILQSSNGAKQMLETASYKWKIPPSLQDTEIL